MLLLVGLRARVPCIREVLCRTVTHTHELVQVIKVPVSELKRLIRGDGDMMLVRRGAMEKCQGHQTIYSREGEGMDNAYPQTANLISGLDHDKLSRPGGAEREGPRLVRDNQ